MVVKVNKVKNINIFRNWVCVEGKSYSLTSAYVSPTLRCHHQPLHETAIQSSIRTLGPNKAFLSSRSQCHSIVWARFTLEAKSKRKVTPEVRHRQSQWKIWFLTCWVWGEMGASEGAKLIRLDRTRLSCNTRSHLRISNGDHFQSRITNLIWTWHLPNITMVNHLGVIQHLSQYSCMIRNTLSTCDLSPLQPGTKTYFRVLLLPESFLGSCNNCLVFI